MHIPKLYKSEDFGLLKEIISNHSFGLLISSKEKLFATHSMFLINGTNEDFMLETHISKANFQAKALKDGDQVLCDFLGAHTYISSSWYDHINVSTWNYEAVQVRGTIKIMTDEEFYKHLEKLTTKYEKYQKFPMTFITPVSGIFKCSTVTTSVIIPFYRSSTMIEVQMGKKNIGNIVFNKAIFCQRFV